MKTKYTVVLHIFLKAVAFMMQERGERDCGCEVRGSRVSWQYASALSRGITYFMCREA